MAYSKQEFDWQAPSFQESGSYRMGWLNETVDESEYWLKGQTAYSDIPVAMDIIAGRLLPDNTNEDLNTNFAKYAIRKMVATWSEVREIGTFGTEAKFFKPNAAMMNKIVKAIYLESQFSRQLRQSLQYMSAQACGFLWPKAKRLKYGTGDLNIIFEPLGLCDVLPFQLPSSNDYQEAYVNTIIEYMPIAEAHARFPLFQHLLLPVGRRRYTSSVSNRRLDLSERFKYGQTGSSWDQYYCEIRWSFIRDISINDTGTVMKMGEEGSSWYHEVPYLGQLLPNGQKAKPEDCRIYPQLRLMSSSRGMNRPMYDGPAYDWSGIMPPVKYCCDDWPWEACGYSLIHDIATSERSRQTLERMMMKVAKSRLAPAMAYDRNAGLNDQTAQNIDVYGVDERLGVDGDPAKVMKALLPDDLMNVPEWEFKWHELLQNGIFQMLGLNDIANFAKMKMNLNSASTFDKLLEFDGPLVKDIAFGMENSNNRITDQLRYLILQWIPTKRVMQYIGADNIPGDTFDLEAESLVPSHGPDELSEQGSDVVVPGASKYTQLQRAKLFAQNLRLISVAHTQHEFTQMEEQLKYLQLYRGGAPIAFVDVAKKLNIDDYGEVPGTTGRERWINEQKENLELKAWAQQLASSIAPPEPAQEAGSGPKGGGKGAGGRAPSGQKAPKIAQRGQTTGNPRTVVKES